MMDDATRRAEIARLNDYLRQTGHGGAVYMSHGLSQLPMANQMEIMAMVQAFDAFTRDNDPHGEHDSASLVVKGRSIIWKIDYYDPDQQYHSTDPANPKLTSRVLTIMLAEEY